LYGTTLGDFHGIGGSGYGTVFKLDSKGKLTLLYSFAGMPDGAFPREVWSWTRMATFMAPRLGAASMGKDVPVTMAPRVAALGFRWIALAKRRFCTPLPAVPTVGIRKAV
jgi:uncharacterized repeat protein (TIGR03803 family)